MDDLISQVSGDQMTPLSQSPKQKSLHEERIRHKAIRPSARLTALITDAVANGGPVDGIRQVKTVVGGLKKYTKNSRRPRGRYGRGLPKKGEPVEAIELVVVACMRYCILQQSLSASASDFLTADRLPFSFILLFLLSPRLSRDPLNYLQPG